MSPIRLSIPLGILPVPVLAHPGHLAEVAGHNHWIAGAAIGAGVAIALWGLLKGRREEAAEEPAAEEAEDTPEESAA
jgi:hypothetical protein